MGDGHEGEVIMHPQQQSSHVMAAGNNGYMQADVGHYPVYGHHQHQSEDTGGYESAGHNPSSAPYPPPLPPPPPHPLPPHKSKNTPVYTYYYIGRHLWYIPLYFSIYFVIYVGLLVLKSIARHKIQFPQNLHEAATTRELHALRSLEKAKEKYFM
ncbi:uncharacterized protein [Rhodnius prolixus]|uniref:uncharacterized protein n=1 Tax=Rhodnius prolixus TaxID=13249 RepID=UPI003D18DE0B